jgi:tetratricopeptide (TPR) repeat protein
MDADNQETEQHQDDASTKQAEPVPVNTRRSLWEMVRSLSGPMKVVLVFLFGTLLTIVLGLFTLGDRINNLLVKWRIENKCGGYAETAREYARKDDFDQSLRVLDQPEVIKDCEDKTYIRILRDEVNLFKIVNQIGPFQLDEDNGKVKALEAGLKIFKDQAEASKGPEFYTLFGILEELRDWPSKAPEQFALAGNYPQAVNAWGIMILRWRIGDADWSTQALTKFDQAGKCNPNYAWPHANKAAVFLELAQDEVNRNQPYNVETAKGEPRLDLAQTFLDKAKESLELAGGILRNEEVRSKRADRSLQDHPRVHMLWAQYYFVQGQVYRVQKDRGRDAENSFRQAISHLQTAKRAEPSVAEASLLLGQTYEELGASIGETGNTQELAIQEYQNAVSIDKDNLQAHMNLAYALYANQKGRKSRDEALGEVAFDLDLLERVRQHFVKRRSKTGDTFAIAWLGKRLKELDTWEDNFRNMEKELKTRR